MSALLVRLSSRIAVKSSTTSKILARGLDHHGKNVLLTGMKASTSSTSTSRLLDSFSMLSRSFTSTSSTSPSADLAEILGREMDEEVAAGSTKMPDELAALKTKMEKDWRIVDDGATVKLFRKESSGAAKVAISVHCQDTVDDAVEEEEEGNEEEERSPPLRFTLAVSKAGKTLVLTCTSEDAEAYVESAAVSSQEVETILSNGGVESTNYQGPAFAELAEDLQEAFHVYLRSLVDEDLAAFLPMYADYLEQQQYVQFLKQAQSIL